MNKRTMISLVASLIVFSVTGVAFFIHSVKRTSDLVSLYRFTKYVSAFYLPQQRRNHGYWEHDLSGLRRFYVQQPNQHRMYGVLENYNNSYLNIKIVSSKPKKITYLIYLKSEVKKCWSSVNPDDGDCD